MFTAKSILIKLLGAISITLGFVYLALPALLATILGLEEQYGQSAETFDFFH